MSKKSNYKKSGDKPEARPKAVAIDTESTAAAVDSAEMVEVFSIDGTSYSMPDAQRSDVALTYLEKIELEGNDAAAYYLLTETIGPEAFAALKGVRGLTDKQFSGVLKRVQDIALPKGRP